MKPSFIILLLFTGSLCHAQPSIQWQRTYGGTLSDGARSLQQTTDSGFIVVGTSVSDDGDVADPMGFNDCWLLKLNSMGNLQWQRSLGGTNHDNAYSVKETSEGGFVVAGFSFSNDGDVSGNHGGADAWVVKLDSGGAILWQRCYGGSGTEEAWDIEETSDGGFVFVGRSSSSDGDLSVNNGSFDFWVVRLNQQGDLIWQKSLGGSNLDIGYSLTQTKDGGYIVAGESQSDDGDVTQNQGNSDFWVIKLAADGKIVWEYSFGGSALDRANDIQPARDSGYVVFGQSASNDGDVQNARGNYDQWLIKISEQGLLEWEKSFGGTSDDFGQSVCVTQDVGYALLGFTSSTDWDVINNDGGKDFWVLKTSDSGDLEWQATLGGSDQERGICIQQTTDQGFILAGEAWSNNGDVSGVQGKNDYWIVKLSAPSSSTSTPEPVRLMLAPNPAREYIQLLWPPVESGARVHITDALGRGHIDTRLDATGVLDVSGLPRGVYWVEAPGAVGRMVKE
ncbi:MAG TPA: T9SS type A sorting domain-containing protein [Saprospiraceae bacterium]|nr:T9SS type A sorting domain-containing protein [Saprospiraceae bacterium]